MSACSGLTSPSRRHRSVGGTTSCTRPVASPRHYGRRVEDLRDPVATLVPRDALGAPLVRHLELHELFPGEEHKATDPVTGRHPVLDDPDVRISYAVSSVTSRAWSWSGRGPSS